MRNRFRTRCYGEGVFDLGDGAALTLLEESDARDLFALVDRNRERLRAWLLWADDTRSAEDSLAFIRATREQAAQGQGFHGCLRVQGRIAGCVGFHGINRSFRSTAIGYWIGGEFEGRGLMTKTVRALVEHAFKDLGLHRIEIRCAVGNARSRAIPERLGFRQEGILRGAERAAGRVLDVVVYGRLATDP
ncbi:MAG TPA: GNAT family protein [Planctomycetota bacterium]|nr:GNAT family protein [Planctomycetota bacterium]